MKMSLEQSTAPPSRPVTGAPAPGRSRLFRHRHRPAVALTLLSIAFVLGDPTHAHAHETPAAAGGDDGRSRGSWAALLLGYAALGALATGGTYLLRDNVFGRSLAVGAAGWGGFGVGAGAGYGLARLRGCGSPDCSTEEEVAVGAGGVLGAVAATIVGHLLTSAPGMSRPYATAAGLAPALVFLTVGTITDW
jgi:hypothetical protein